MVVRYPLKPPVGKLPVNAHGPVNEGCFNFLFKDIDDTKCCHLYKVPATSMKKKSNDEDDAFNIPVIGLFS